MSIALLAQVYDETRRLAIAGSVVAPKDFRLEKLVAPLEQAGAKAPVFAKVAEGVKAVVGSNDKTSAQALLDLATLVNAILYTQGETGAPGPLETIETTDLGLQATQTSARVLKPLLEALSTTGSGRLELIRDAHARGAFRAESVAHVLDQRRRADGAKPIIIALPDDPRVRDQVVHPHRLDAYDNLAARAERKADHE
jgi:hypothetical protein